uniref:Striatin n=1 Tax=Takifugu rubripes TaxID=31033 RepID=H2TJH4_TAKRU
MDELATPAVFFNSSSSSGGGNVRAPQASAEAGRAQYNIPGILHFLRHEWARFEGDRAQWEVERAELQAQISFLQGERRGQENLKKDLVRRIKMLEYSLRQERAKHYKLKYGTEVEEVEPPNYDSGVFDLCTLRYLQEVGYTGTILDVKSHSVRALLGLTVVNPSESRPEPMINSTKASSPKDGGVLRYDTSGQSGFSNHVLFLLLRRAAEFSIEDDSEDRDKSIHEPMARTTSDLSEDTDTEEALKGFDFLASPDELDGSAEWRSGEDSGEWEPMTFLPSTGKCFILGRVDEAVSNEFGLGELARITVANEVDNLTFENNKDALRKTWNPKFTLRSHFDSVRNLAFHPVEPVLVTASEDQTVKLWNLQKTVPAKKCAALDVEPIYTFRAHSGAVLSVTMSSSGEQCFSGGVDGTIQSWNTPEANTDPYDSYEPSVLRGALYGHTDAVWGLAYSSAHQRLLSCSADGTLRLWDATNTSPSLTVFNERGELGCPTSVDLVSSNPDHMVVSFTSGDLVLFNMETQQLLLKMEASGWPDASCHINKVLSHPTLPVTITAQDDRNIRFFDNNTGHLIHSMVAHLDEVTCLAVDPNGLYLMSGSHDCSIRLWNMESRTCIQEFTAHRRKFHESIHDVAFHPTKCYVGSAGADALAKVFV